MSTLAAMGILPGRLEKQRVPDLPDRKKRLKNTRHEGDDMAPPCYSTTLAAACFPKH